MRFVTDRQFSLLFIVVPLIFSSRKHAMLEFFGYLSDANTKIKRVQKTKITLCKPWKLQRFLICKPCSAHQRSIFPKFGLDHPSTSQIEVIPFKCWAFKLIPLNCSTTSNCLTLQAIWKGVYSVSKYQLQVLNWSNLSSIFGIVFMATLGQQFLGS